METNLSLLCLVATRHFGTDSHDHVEQHDSHFHGKKETRSLITGDSGMTVASSLSRFLPAWDAVLRIARHFSRAFHLGSFVRPRGTRPSYSGWIFLLIAVMHMNGKDWPWVRKPRYPTACFLASHPPPFTYTQRAPQTPERAGYVASFACSMSCINSFTTRLAPKNPSMGTVSRIH